jgi:ketosteroid isomerase-like protein
MSLAGSNTESQMETLLTAFGKAYFRADVERLSLCTTADFEWHQHAGPSPFGRILRGVRETCEEVLRRKRMWSDVRYEGFENFFTSDLIVSVFEVSGIDESKNRFHTRAVDLYLVRNGRIARKDSYWKQIK